MFADFRNQFDLTDVLQFSLAPNHGRAAVLFILFLFLNMANRHYLDLVNIILHSEKAVSKKRLPNNASRFYAKKCKSD